MAKKKHTRLYTILLFPIRLVYKCIFYPYLFFFHMKAIIKHFICYENIDKMSGIEFEKYVQYLLQQNGYTNVEMTATSNDYGVDILAMKGNDLYAFQCKKYSSKVGVEAVRQASTGCTYYDHDIPVVITNSTFSSQAKRLAETLEVELWDFEILQQLIKHSYKARRRKWMVYSILVTILFIICLFYFYQSHTNTSLYLLTSISVIDICLWLRIIFTKKDTY